MRYRWVDDRERPGARRRILEDDGQPPRYWGIVEELGDGDWFAAFPVIPDPRRPGLAEAEAAVEGFQGIDPSEVER